MLPESTVLGKLSIIETYEFYDMPILFACENKAGHTYLAVWIDETAEKDTWLYVPLSKKRLQKIRSGMIDLHDAFGEPEDEVALEVTVYHNPAKKSEVRPIPLQDLNEDWLPLPEDYLDITDSSPFILWTGIHQAVIESRTETQQFIIRYGDSWHLKHLNIQGTSRSESYSIKYPSEGEEKPFPQESFERLKKQFSQAINTDSEKKAASVASWSSIRPTHHKLLNSLDSFENLEPCA